jgi:glycosyltransferase involved in cell wall biosynthesis
VIFPDRNTLSVLFLISSEGFFGVENMLVNLALALRILGCRCVVGVFCDSRIPHTEVGDMARALGLTVEMIPCAGRFDPRAVARIRKLQAFHEVDVLHTHGYKADAYARAAAWPQRTALVATCHNWPSSLWNMRLYAAFDHLVLRGFDRVAVISDAVAEILRRSGLQHSRIQFIPNGVKVERFRDAKPALRRELAFGEGPLVGFVGRLVPGKGGDILLRAAHRVLSAVPKGKFVLVGGGPCREEWEELSSALGIRDSIVFAGIRSDMPSVYASLDLLVLPSLCEAMPMCLLEGMAAGKPVIATRVGAVSKVVSDDAGLLVEPGDIDGFAAAMIQLLTQPAQARKMGANGQARVIEHFSAETMGAQYLDLYRDVLEHRKHSKKDVPLYSQ